MQTMGAMLAIYLVIYILAVQRLSTTRSGVIFVTKLLYFIILLCGTTIILSALWLDSLLTNFFISHYIRIIASLAFVFFIASVFAICSYSIALTYKLFIEK